MVVFSKEQFEQGMEILLDWGDDSSFDWCPESIEEIEVSELELELDLDVEEMASSTFSGRSVELFSSPKFSKSSLV